MYSQKVITMKSTQKSIILYSELINMKKLYILLVLTFWYGTSALAQRGRGAGERGKPEISIVGKLIDQASNLPLEYATISLFGKSDSLMVGGGLSDEMGVFSMNTKPGTYYAKIEFIGYESLYIDDIPFDRETIRTNKGKLDLGTLYMSEGGIALDEVEIRAEKSETSFSLDKRVFNVGSDLANRGGTAEEILDNVPSVTVDIEGEVSLRGSTGVRILINGRPSGLAGGGNANGLRSIPSNMIDKVEVITNPSARYEAEGMAGIINIILKKEERSGFNGSLDASIGYPNQQGLGANLNYRKGDVNWFLNYGVNHRRNPGGGFRYQERYMDNTTLITDQQRDNDRGGLSNSIRFGIDYYLKENETLTGAFLYRISNEDNVNEIVYKDYIDDFPSNLISTVDRRDDEQEDESNLEYSLVYRNQINGDRDHELTGTIQYGDDIESESSAFTEFLTLTGEPAFNNLNQRSANDEGEKKWLFQIDYTRPLGSPDHKFEIGARTSLRNIGNDYLVEEENNSGQWSSIAGLSNMFNYDENIYAGYLIYGNKFDKVSYQLGLRVEYSDVLTELKNTNEINDRSYFNFFPSAHLSYNLSEGNDLQLSYSRRIRRPRFWYLNPFFTFSDSRNFFSGNPNLDPEFTDSYEIGYLKIWEQITFGSSVYYRITDDNIERLLTLNDDGTTFTRPVNLSTRKDYGLEFTMSYSGISWLRLDANANVFNSRTQGFFEEQSFETENETWNGRLTARITLWDKSNLQIRTNYRGAMQTPQGNRDGRGTVDLGWSKDVKNFTFTISGRDIFNSRRRSGETFLDDFYERSEFQWRTRTVNLAVNYRINQKKQRGKPNNRDSGGGGDEF